MVVVVVGVAVEVVEVAVVLLVVTTGMEALVVVADVAVEITFCVDA